MTTHREDDNGSAGAEHTGLCVCGRDWPCPGAWAGPKYKSTPALFPLGRKLATPAALRAFARNAITPAFVLAQHERGKWGDLSPDDKHANDVALADGSRILSAYELPDNTKVWVITEASRKSTTILLPEEY